MKLLIALLITTSVFASPSIGGNLADSAINFTAHQIFKIKTESLYQKAIQCSTLKIDYETGKTVLDWMKVRPELPNWQSLKSLEKVAYQAKEYAGVHYGRDKLKHCYAGCFIRKKSGLKSAVMVGWLKELVDASNCNNDSRFEEADYFATVAGAIGGEFDNCEHFCHRSDIKKASSQEMLDIAAKENNIDLVDILKPE